jgi:hypothetical protein
MDISPRQHVEQPRYLVQAVAPQETTDPSDPRIPPQLEQHAAVITVHGHAFGQQPFRIDNHAAERRGPTGMSDALSGGCRGQGVGESKDHQEQDSTPSPMT